MLDYRIETFLTLCSTLSYTLTAQQLNMTQPAVTQQIHWLEEKYGCRLFSYEGRVLRITPEGELLRAGAVSMRHNEKSLLEQLSRGNAGCPTLHIGATKTIGEYVIGDRIIRYLRDERHSLSLTVDNTVRLLAMLENGELDFALIEGFFDKSRYDYRLLRNEPFVGLCSARHPFSGREVRFEELFGECVILREPGSGTRDILEKSLYHNSYTLQNFRRCVEISSFAVLKKLVAADVGISFAYRAVAAAEALSSAEGEVAEFRVAGMEPEHEFNSVFLKNTLDTRLYDEFCFGC